jgi:hypothetical protein
MVERGKVHRRLDVDTDVRILTADQVWVDRCKSIDEGYPPVGLAEYLDLLQALHELSDRAGNSADARRAVQRDWLTRLSRYALVKHAAQDQSRLPVAAPQRGGAGS